MKNTSFSSLPKAFLSLVIQKQVPTGFSPYYLQSSAFDEWRIDLERSHTHSLISDCIDDHKECLGIMKPFWLLALALKANFFQRISEDGDVFCPVLPAQPNGSDPRPAPSEFYAQNCDNVLSNFTEIPCV